MCLPVKPFKVEREWDHAGLKCAVVQAREGGHRCGYVRVGPAHPMHGKHYDEVDVRVHYGLTFGDVEPCAHEDGTGFWFGFDCAHAGDAYYDPDNLPQHQVEFRLKHPEFDNIHESEHFWTQPEVERETELLAEQLAVFTEEAS